MVACTEGNSSVRAAPRMPGKAAGPGARGPRGAFTGGSGVAPHRTFWFVRPKPDGTVVPVLKVAEIRERDLLESKNRAVLM